MIKSLTTTELRGIINEISECWGNDRNNIKVGVNSMYNIIKLKKELERQGVIIQETVATLAEQSGGEKQQNGSYKIPEDKIAALNVQLDDFGKEEIEIEYTPIKIKESDNVPPTLMDALFDFIELE